MKRLISNIKRVIKWLPIVWKTRDFDYTYAIDVFTFQLKNTADYLDSDKAYTVDAKYNAARIRTTIKLIEKVINEDYEMEWIDKVEKLYGKEALAFKFIPVENKPEFSELKWGYEFMENAEHIHKMKETLCEISKYKQQKAENIAIKLLKTHLKTWWD